MLHRLGVLAKEAGFRGLFAGLGPRIVMTAGLVSGQFLVYGAIKDGKSPELFSLSDAARCAGADGFFFMLALGAPPGIEIHKE